MHIVIQKILERNKEVEVELLLNTDSNLMEDVNISGEGGENLGEIEGYFENLEVYCGMAFDRKEDVTPLFSEGAENSLFVWIKDCITILKQRDCSLQESQPLAISYLWEICDDLLLAKKDNV